MHTFEYEYALEPLPPGRRGVRRWRWELWDGASLLAAGWHVTPTRAHVALRIAASRSAHEALGLRLLRPALNASAAPAAGPRAVMRVGVGPVECLLTPREPTSSSPASALA